MTLKLLKIGDISKLYLFLLKQKNNLQNNMILHPNMVYKTPFKVYVLGLIVNKIVKRLNIKCQKIVKRFEAQRIKL